MNGLYTILLLVLSNVFMTLAWYGHLRLQQSGVSSHWPLLGVIAFSWCIAFFEYLIMEYLEGETLKERLKREGTLSEEEALGILLPVLEALERIHSVGLIHRDVAPDNIFLTKMETSS